MANRASVLDETRVDIKRLRLDVGREIRNARLPSGTSQRTAGRRVGMSHAQFGRIERGELPGLTIDQAARACAAVGLRLLVRAVPGPDPALDAGQLALLDRLRRELPASATLRTEVPLPLAGDRRAWDGMIDVEEVSIAVEAEARLRDIQALERRCALKRRDGGVAVLILLVADTVANRRMLAVHREALRASFPLDTRQVLAALRAGRAPGESGIVVL